LLKSRIRLFLSAAVFVGLAVATGACQSPTETELRTAGWAPHEVVARGTPIFCYTSIGDRQCYAEPLIGEQRRLIRPYAPVN
jgi:hypothetical protein